MRDSEREKLFDPKREYLNLGISEGGVFYNRTQVVWESTAAAYNMRCPDVYIAPEDIFDEEIMARIFSLTVRGLYIYTAIDDYSFIGRLTELWDIHIREAYKMPSLDFLKDLHDVSMLFIGDARLDNIDIIWDLKRQKKGFLPEYRYLGLYNCRIDRVPPEDQDVHFTELLIWNTDVEQKRWDHIPALTKRYTVIPSESD